jgi:hypothetical protein
MHPRLSCLLAATLSTAALLAAPAAQANIVANGGFETGDFTGWTVSGAGAFTGVDGTTPQAGSYAAYVGDPATLRQTLNTVAGQHYTIDFWLQAEADVTGAAAPNSFEFDWAGAAVMSLTDAAATNGYVHYSFDLVANSALTDLAFQFSNSPAFWDLDSVSANRVPEPGSLALVALAAGLASLQARRRRPALQST